MVRAENKPFKHQGHIYTSFNGHLHDHKCFSQTTTGAYIRPGVAVWNTVKIGSQQPKTYIYVLDECSEQPKAYVYIYILITKLCLCFWLFDLNSIGCC